MNQEWATSPRWVGVERPYAAEQVLRLRGSFAVEYTLARMGAERLWELMKSEPFVRALGPSRATRRADGAGRSQGHLHEWLAGSGRQQHFA